jgi:hypothetical protein
MKDNYRFENFLETQIGKSVGIEKGICSSNAGVLLARINSTLFKVGLSGDFIEVRSDNLFFIDLGMREAYAAYSLNLKRNLRLASASFEDTLTQFMVALIEHNQDSHMLIVDLAAVKDRIYRGVSRHVRPRNFIDLTAKIDDVLTFTPVVNRLGHWCVVTPDTSEDDYILLVECGSKEDALPYGQATLAYIYTLALGRKKVSLTRAKIPDEINVTFTEAELELKID